MPFALSSLADGKTPAWRSASPGDVQPGEVVVDEPPFGKVWDAQKKTLRLPTSGEALDERKAAKRRELVAAFSAECAADFAVPWSAIGVLAANPQDAGVEALETRTAKLGQKLSETSAATTAAEVDAVRW
jgi:hypothetical protein